MAGEYDVSCYEVGDRRLARAGATLSRRLENGNGIWRLELPRPSGTSLTVEQPGGPVAPPERIARLPAFLRGARLGEVVETAAAAVPT